MLRRYSSWKQKVITPKKNICYASAFMEIASQQKELKDWISSNPPPEDQNEAYGYYKENTTFKFADIWKCVRESIIMMNEKKQSGSPLS